ncbi:MAG: hypothetical protein ACRDRR_14980 [Pseudonocardiaceae bacterium]
MAKNAGQTVAALLAKAPPPPRRASASSAPALEPDPGEKDAHEVESSAEAAPPATVVAAAAAPSRDQRRSPRSGESSAPAEPAAPPTLRLSQPTAEALRAAWLEEKSSRVLLTYQDFAGEVITAGLRGGSRETAVGDEASSGDRRPVPRTLRLSQPTAEALRAAWLEEKRSRVLLTYQDFAGEIITAGLRQARQHTPQQ